MLLPLAETGSTSILNSETVTFVVDSAKQFIGIMTQPPFGVFITIGVLGAVVGLVASLIYTVRR